MNLAQSLANVTMLRFMLDMRSALAPVAALFTLTACVHAPRNSGGTVPIDIKIVAFNDFHGALEPPKTSIEATAPDGSKVRVPAGGAAYLASAIDTLRARNPNHVVVSAGDMIGASPITSSLFLDEPTILTMNMIGIDFNAVGNHEFDRGRAELLRIQNGGCAKNTVVEPCQVDRPFPGAKFSVLAANVLTESGKPLLPATGMRSFGTGRAQVKVGFIGLTLKDTANLVTPGGVAGLRFTDEAATVNAEVPRLKAAGADAIVVLIHQGIRTTVAYNDKSCGGAAGDLLDIVMRFDPAVDVVVSGHTHWAYICEIDRAAPARPLLLTSAGLNGAHLTDIDLSIDPGAHRVVAARADNIIVQSSAYDGPRGRVTVQPDFPAFAPRSDVQALVDRYRAAVRSAEAEVVGMIGGPAPRDKNEAGESILGNLIADAQLEATRLPEKGGAQIALMNPDGVRTGLTPDADGRVTFGAIFAAQPFSNTLVVRGYTGQQIRALLEQQLNDPNWIRIFSVSQGFRFAYDRSKPPGQRILSMSLDNAPIEDSKTYRVTMNSFLAGGGDRFSAFTLGTGETMGPGDLDALRAYIAAGRARTLPALDRITNRTPR